MARLTRADVALGVGSGMLAGAVIALAGQFFGLGLPVEAALCVITAIGLGIGFAARGGGQQ